MALLPLSIACGGGSPSSGGGQNRPPASNPVPAIVSLSPNSANAGGAAFTLTITGQSFVSTSTVQWNGKSVQTMYSSATQLQVQINASQVANSGSAMVSVVNPSPGGGNSGEAEFAILSTSNPTPSLLGINPSTVSAGSAEFILVVNGSNFIPTSTIEWNGTPLSTTFLSEIQLEAQVPASNVAVSGFSDVTVTNPAPGGGVSSAAAFSVAYGPTIVNQLANDLVWDATHQLIYLSIPSLAGSNGNSVAALDPSTAVLQPSHFVGSEPDHLAISGDDQYLYVGVDGSASVQRLTLPGLQPDISYLLGANDTYGPYFALDLEVAPGLSHTTAVSRGVTPSSITAYGGMAIYDDATERPTIANAAGDLYDSLQWGSDSTLYANNGEVSNFDLYVLTANANGVTQTKDYTNEFSQFYMSIHYNNTTGLIYGDDGTVISPSSGQHVASFAASGLMIPDSATNTAFFLGQTSFQAGSTSYTIESFDLTTYAPLAEIVVANVQGTPTHFIRWGSNGLAFIDDAGYIYIFNNPFAEASLAVKTAHNQSLRPVQKTWTIPKKLSRRSDVVTNRGTKRKLSGKQAMSESGVASPTPAITTLSPNTVVLGDISINGFTLTVTGSNFISLSTVEWAGTPLPTEMVSSTELQAQVSFSAQLTSAGSVPVNVITPSPGGGTSNTLQFAIISETPNPTPVILSLYPDSAVAGSSGLTVNINGLAYFNASSIVYWNGSTRPASLYGPGQLQVQVNASDLVTPGVAQVTVLNPGPGGGMSNAGFFQVLYQPTAVNQVTNDMVWDPSNQVFYISVPGTAGTHANQVCILNPVSATIVNCVAAGNDPDRLAISDDSQYLYVGENGTGTVQRFILPGLTPDISYSLGNYVAGSPYYALDLQVAPGSPHTTAVTKGAPDVIPIAEGGITIFDDATPRPISAPGWSSPPSGKTYDSLQWGSDATELYASNTESTNDFFALSVNSSGVTLTADYMNVFWNPAKIHFDSGNSLIYGDDGYHAVIPSTGLPAGIFEVGGGWPLAPDSKLNTVFLLSEYIWQGTSNYTIDMFDATHYLLMNQIPFATQSGISELGRFIRWGNSGLAVNDRAGNIYLISGPFVSAVRKKASLMRINSPSH